MARIDGEKKWAAAGGSREALSARQRMVVGGVLVGVMVVGIGIWWGSASSGVELTRGDDVAGEPSDPGTVEDAEMVEGELDGDAPGGDGGEATDSVPATTKVHVDGAVLIPGVYELYGSDPRVADAVGAAGGLAEDADTSAVNLAAPLSDGDKVHIPRVEEQAPPVAGVGEVAPGSSTVPSGSTSASGASGGGSASTSGPININIASAEELTALPGIGEKTAEKIVADREAQGPFVSPEDLMRVSGIGEKKFAQIRDLICV